jgi:hypothetical protein
MQLRMGDNTPEVASTGGDWHQATRMLAKGQGGNDLKSM